MAAKRAIDRLFGNYLSNCGLRWLHLSGCVIAITVAKLIAPVDSQCTDNNQSVAACRRRDQEPHSNGLYHYGLYSQGINNYGLSSHGLCSYGHHS